MISHQAVNVGPLHPPDPPLQNERLSLRLFCPDDAEVVARASRDSDITTFTFTPNNMSIEDAAEWIADGRKRWPRGRARFAITVPPSDVAVGEIGLGFKFDLRGAEASYWIVASARRQGIAAEAPDLVTRWAFDVHNIVRVQLVAHPSNVGSQVVAERCGFTREGLLRSWEFFEGDSPDVVMWSRLRTDPA